MSFPLNEKGEESQEVYSKLNYVTFAFSESQKSQIMQAVSSYFSKPMLEIIV